MAKTGAEPAGTAGSQFFVVTGADAGLPPQYALLGKVTEGLDVVERIGRLGNASEQPTRRIVIRRMTLTPERSRRGRGSRPRRRRVATIRVAEAARAAPARA